MQLVSLYPLINTGRSGRMVLLVLTATSSFTYIIWGGGAVLERGGDYSPFTREANSATTGREQFLLFGLERTAKFTRDRYDAQKLHKTRIFFVSFTHCHTGTSDHRVRVERFRGGKIRLGFEGDVALKFEGKRNFLGKPAIT